MNKLYPRLLTIQDLSCFGQCSLTVALPVLSACGVETAVLPTALLSTHTGGFEGFTFRSLTDEMERIAAHWQHEGICFDAIYTGYLGDKQHVPIIRQLMKTVLAPNGMMIVDPAFADHGKLYTGFDEEYVEAMRELVCHADFLLPNMTEARMLTGTQFSERQDPEQAELLLGRLKAMGAKNIVLKGVRFYNDHLGIAVLHGEKTAYYQHRRVEQAFHGTGDLFASAFTGALLKGWLPYEAAKLAADFVLHCIDRTLGDEQHRYGVKFELALPELVGRLNR